MQENKQVKQLDDIKNAPFTFPAKELTRYFDISYIQALRLAREENFGFRLGEKRLYVYRDKFIQWMDKRSETRESA